MLPVKRIAWLTDLHLNFAGEDAVPRLATAIEECGPDAIVIGGDTGEAPSFATYLQGLAERLARPIYFVLGNHDYYYGSIHEVRERARRLSRGNEHLHWLPDVGAVPLTETAALVGHGGWADGRCGSFHDSEVLLNDYLLIRELRNAVELDRDRAEGPVTSCGDLHRLLSRLNALGDEAADHFRRVLPDVLERYSSVYVVTHVPPFREACWHEGLVSDKQWLPHFTCQAVGEVLREFMEGRLQCRMTVLCGHTHSPGRARLLPNLEVFTGGAEYGKPAVQRVLEVC